MFKTNDFGCENCKAVFLIKFFEHKNILYLQACFSHVKCSFHQDRCSAWAVTKLLSSEIWKSYQLEYGCREMSNKELSLFLEMKTQKLVTCHDWLTSDCKTIVILVIGYQVYYWIMVIKISNALVVNESVIIMLNTLLNILLKSVLCTVKSLYRWPHGCNLFCCTGITNYPTDCNEFVSQLV